MAQPKKRLTNTRSGNRRSHLAISATSVVTCPECQSLIAPHTACAKCGMYRGNRVIKVASAQKKA